MYLLLHASTSADNHSKNRPKVCLFRSCVKRDFPLHLPALRGQAHPLSEGDQIGLVDQFNRRVGRSRRTKKGVNPSLHGRGGPSLPHGSGERHSGASSRKGFRRGRQCGHHRPQRPCRTWSERPTSPRRPIGCAALRTTARAGARRCVSGAGGPSDPAGLAKRSAGSRLSGFETVPGLAGAGGSRGRDFDRIDVTPPGAILHFRVDGGPVLFHNRRA